jgi:hypothetical protein
MVYINKLKIKNYKKPSKDENSFNIKSKENKNLDDNKCNKR